MKQVPDIDERDRNIESFSFDDPAEAQTETGPSLLDAEVTEEADGSATVTLPEDEEEVLNLDFLENLAETFEERELSSLATSLVELVKADKESRKRRDEQYEEGLRRTGLGEDAPGGASFSGASKVVHPILAESCVDFASRAIKELFPPSGPVKTAIIGSENPDKLARAERKAKYMNYQMTVKMSEYRPELEQLLVQLPMGGSQYQKFWHDARFKRARTEFIPIDDILLPYAATDFYTAGRVTHVQHLTDLEFRQRQKSGLYREIDVLDTPSTIPEQTATGAANDKIEGRSEDAFNEDGLRDVYEIYTWQEFDDDDVAKGEPAPYIVTIDVYSEKVLAIYRNWEEQDESFAKLDWLVEWKFIPWRGAYAIGFPHLIGGLSGAATGALRALLDSAHINNSQSLVKLRAGKMSGQNIEIEPTQIAEIEGPAGTDDIRKVIMAMPYNPPSPVLFQLLGWLTDAGKGVIATTEEAMANAGNRTPVGTTMAMVEQGSTTYSAIHARLHYSQFKAMQILERINRTFLDDESVVKDLGEQIVKREDFEQSADVIPVSDPLIFSETQRYAQMQGVMQLQASMPDLPFNKIAIARRMLARLRIEGVDEILPEPPKPQNMNPIAENVAAMHGAPLVALPKQNHMAHIFAHLEFATSPLFANPVLGSKMMPLMLEHITQHIGFFYADEMARMSNYENMAEGTPTKQIEDMLAMTNEQVLSKLQSALQPVMEKLMQVAEFAKQFAPPPPMDPAVQATKEVAMAEIERKKVSDQGQLELKKQQVLNFEPQNEQAKQQIDLLKNEQDNAQKMQTELLKNQGDNQTKQFIAAMEYNMAQLQNKFQAQLDQQTLQNEQRHETLMAQLQHKSELALQQAAPTTQPASENGV